MTDIFGNETTPIKDRRAARTAKRMPKEVFDLIISLREILIGAGDDRSVFRTVPPADETHYTKTVGRVVTYLEAIYSGQFFRLCRLDPEYAEKRIDHAVKQRIRKAKGSWDSVGDLMREAVENYRLKFHLDRYPERKDGIVRCMAQWTYDGYRRQSLFVESLAGPPELLEQTVANRVRETLPESIVVAAEPLLLSSYKEASFWARIGGVVGWYEDTRGWAVKEDSNAGYWFGRSVDGWFAKYVEYLKGFDGLRLKQIGVGNPTWDSWVDRARSTHEIQVDFGG